MKRAWSAIAAALTLLAPGLDAAAGSRVAGNESGEQKVLEQFLDEGPFSGPDDELDHELLSDLDGTIEGGRKGRHDRMKVEMQLDGNEASVAAKASGSRGGVQGRKSVEVQLGAEDQHFLEARQKRQQNAATAASKPSRAPAVAQTAGTRNAVAAPSIAGASTPGLAVGDHAAVDSSGSPQTSRVNAAVAPQPALASQPAVSAPQGRAQVPATGKPATGTTTAASHRSSRQPSEAFASEQPEELFGAAPGASPRGKARRAPSAATADEFVDGPAAEDPDATGDMLAGMLTDTPSGAPSDDDELLAEAAASRKRARPAPSAARAGQYATASRKVGKLDQATVRRSSPKVAAAGKAGKASKAERTSQTGRPYATERIAASDKRKAASASDDAVRSSQTRSSAKTTTAAQARGTDSAPLEASADDIAATDAPGQALALAQHATQGVGAAKGLTSIGKADSLTAPGSGHAGLVGTLLAIGLLAAAGAASMIWRNRLDTSMPSDDQDEAQTLA